MSSDYTDDDRFDADATPADVLRRAIEQLPADERHRAREALERLARDCNRWQEEAENNLQLVRAMREAMDAIVAGDREAVVEAQRKIQRLRQEAP